uniref:Uncharacterized protein n=1 Tax=Arundo donax TaxID=35708 RepID=A0A0A9ATY1_ARUDO
MFHWPVDENCHLHRCCSYGVLFNYLAFCESLSFYPSCHHSILQLVNLSLLKISNHMLTTCEASCEISISFEYVFEVITKSTLNL